MADGWGREPIQPPSIWLRLKSKGESAKIRIAAMPMREVTVWPDEEGAPKLDPELLRDLTMGQWLRLKSLPDYKVSEQFPLLVIDRADGQAKIYRASSFIYSEIRKYAQDPEWGNPMGYDITITRVENPGVGYWDIKPSPNKTDLMQSEVEKIKALNLSKLLPDAYPANEPQPDDIELNNTVPETLPWEKQLVPRTAAEEAALLATAEPKPAAQPATSEPQKGGALQNYEDPAPKPGTEDVVIEDIGDQPVNLDDIPF
jgi:hypothetical protein